MMMNLGLGWRRGYSAMAGLKSSFTHLPMQLLSGDRDANTLYINQPTVGVPGPNHSFNAVEFNKDTPIQRAVSKSQQFFISVPSGFHTSTLVYLEQLTDTVIWALVPAKSMNDVTAQFRLRLKYSSGYSMWLFALELLTGGSSPTIFWEMTSRVYDYYDYYNMYGIEIPETYMPTPVISVPGWYNIVTSIPYVNSSDTRISMYVNGDISGSGSTGAYARAYLYPYQNLALFFSVADDDLYDGILGQTEGASRLVGRVADFAYSFSALSTSDTYGTYTYMNFSEVMALRLAANALTQSSPFEKPHLSVKANLAPCYKNSLQTQLGFRGSL